MKRRAFLRVAAAAPLVATPAGRAATVLAPPASITSGIINRAVAAAKAAEPKVWEATLNGTRYYLVRLNVEMAESAARLHAIHVDLVRPR